MRTATGQPYVCQIPYVVNQTSIEEAPEDNKDVDLMKKGLASLEPLQDNCLYYVSLQMIPIKKRNYCCILNF